MIKRIFYILILLLTISCYSIDERKEINHYDKQIVDAVEILFNVNAAHSTKAIVDSTFLPRNTYFGVYGYVHGVFVGKEMSGGTSGYIIQNAKYNYDGTSNNDRKYYWPKADNNDDLKVRFVAYYPYYLSYSIIDINNRGNITYNFNNYTKDDVMIAITDTVLPDASYTESNKYIIPLTFKHVLSLVTFKAKIQPDSLINRVVIKEITLSNPIDTAAYINVDSRGVSDSIFLTYRTKGKNLYNFISSPTTVTSKDTYSTVSNDVILPQRLDFIKVKLRFDTYFNIAEDSVHYDRVVEKYISINEDVNGKPYVDEWLPGYHYIYTYYITENQINFDATVAPWYEPFEYIIDVK